MASISTLVSFLIFGIFEISQCNNRTENFINLLSDNNNYYQIQMNDVDTVVARPQIGSIQKLFETFGILYENNNNNTNKSDNFNIEEYYKEYKNNTNLSEIFEIESPNFPLPYPVNKITKYLITVENSSIIEFIIHTLDINEENDFLKFTPINKNDNRPILILTGKQITPIKFRIFNTEKLQIDFGAFTNFNHKCSGFLLTYKSYIDDEFNSTTQPTLPLPPTNSVIPYDNLDDIKIIIILLENQQTNNTWEKLRYLLCNATNEWINNTRIPLQICNTNNVTFKSIIKCPKYFKNSLTCIQLTFSISLYLNKEKYIIINNNPLIEENEIKYPDGLTKIQLEYVWNKYGKNIFYNNNIYEYNELNTTNELISIWIGISLLIIIISLIILFIICRTNLFKKYLNSFTSSNNEIYENDKNYNDNIEFDITTIPSPEQIIPEVIERYANDYYDITNTIKNENNLQNINSLNVTDANHQNFNNIQNNSINNNNKDGVENSGFDSEDEKITYPKK